MILATLLNVVLCAASVAAAGETAPGVANVVVEVNAVADGKSDCAAAIQKAIDELPKTGGRVVLPPSKLPYVIGRTVVIAADNVELEGTGATIQLADEASSGKAAHCLVISGTEEKPIRGVVVRGLTVDANYWNQTDANKPRAIECQWASGVLIDKVTVRRAWVSLAFSQGSVHSEARDCTVTLWHNDGFDVSGGGVTGSTHHIKFVRCRAVDALDEADGGLPGGRDDAWEIEDGATDIELIECVVENTSGKGFGIRNHRSPGRHTRNITFTRCRTKKVAKFAFWADSISHSNSVSGIRLFDCETDSALSFRGPSSSLEITGGKFTGRISIGTPARQFLPAKDVTITGAEIAELIINLQPGNDGRESYQPALTLKQTTILESFEVLGDRTHVKAVECQLP